MKITDLDKNDCNEYYWRYIQKIPEHLEIRKGFEVGCATVIRFFNTIPQDKLSFRYASDKWSIKEVLQHLIDTERVFMYRCFRISRKDKTPLAGFDQNIYVEPSGAHDKSMDSLIEEFKTIRQSSISFINSVSDDHLEVIGNANGGHMSARSAAFTIIGHEIWHMDVIKEKYL